MCSDLSLSETQIVDIVNQVQNHITFTCLQSLGSLDCFCKCAGLTLPGLFGAVGGVAIAVSLRYGVGLLGVKHWEHSLSALPQSHPNASICIQEGSLIRYGSGGGRVHCRKRKGRRRTYKESERVKSGGQGKKEWTEENKTKQPTCCTLATYSHC